MNKRWKNHYIVFFSEQKFSIFFLQKFNPMCNYTTLWNLATPNFIFPEGKILTFENASYVHGRHAKNPMMKKQKFLKMCLRLIFRSLFSKKLLIISNLFAKKSVLQSGLIIRRRKINIYMLTNKPKMNFRPNKHENYRHHDLCRPM